MNGSITLPDIVDYPDFYKVSENKQLFNKKFCYIIEPYDIKFGLSMYVGFRKSDVFTRISDFLSNVIDIKESKDHYITKLLSKQAKLVNLLKSAMIVDSILYFSKVNNDLVLVDVMISGNKFAGPGMLRDLFSKVCVTQKVSEIKIIDDDDVLKVNHGKFIKPSRYQYCIENNNPRPLYGIIDEI